MTPETVYTYIRGKGWVVNGTPSVECTMACGAKIRIEARKPEPGEYFGYTVYRSGCYSAWANEDGTPNLERFKLSFANERLEWRDIKNADENYYSGTPETRVWVTIVPV